MRCRSTMLVIRITKQALRRDLFTFLAGACGGSYSLLRFRTGKRFDAERGRARQTMIELKLEMATAGRGRNRRNLRIEQQFR